MKQYIIISIILLLTCQCFSDPILDKLKAIDDAMTQGTVSYYDEGTMKNQANEPIKIKFNIVYSKTGAYKISGGRHQTFYFDGKEKFEYENNTKILMRERDNISPVVAPDNSGFLLLFGRGLSKLENIEIKDNVLTGYRQTSKIVATLDPEHDYLATRVERYSTKTGTLYLILEYYDPILIDNKYYIASYIEQKGDFHKVSKKYTIDSATFKEPNKEDYTFTEKNVDVLDNRQDIPILQRNASEKSPEEIAKETQRKLEEYEKEGIIRQPKNNNKNIIIYSLSFIVLLIIIFALIRKFKKEK